MLANAQHIRNVPGRKTDVNDAMWIADLLAHGLIRTSFVPPAPIQELRDLTRTRKQLVREISQHSLRIQKVLEDANIKLGSVLSDVLGTQRPRHARGHHRRRERSRNGSPISRWAPPRKKTPSCVEALRGRVTAASPDRCSNCTSDVIDALESRPPPRSTPPWEKRWRRSRQRAAC